MESGMKDTCISIGTSFNNIYMKTLANFSTLREWETSGTRLKRWGDAG